jgi:hypothetical protein
MATLIKQEGPKQMQGERIKSKCDAAACDLMCSAAKHSPTSKLQEEEEEEEEEIRYSLLD